MTPDVVVDIGNSRMKWGLVLDGRIAQCVVLSHGDPASWERHILTPFPEPGPLRWAVAGVHPENMARFVEWAERRGDTIAVIADFARLPLRVAVDEPARVGIDRLLNAVAAKQHLSQSAPGVVIDVGSATTVDYLDGDGVFRGGAILPGPWMMARSLHDFTAKLPMVEPTAGGPIRAVGTNTEAAIRTGIRAAVCGAAEVIIRAVLADPGPAPDVFITGGGADFLRGLPEALGRVNVRFDQGLTLEGIRLAAEALP